jgi:hypothetical protein|tara:strand:+ start:818 stop:1066 length:249 start_codon:yes stop_codon:yes gene_type:complete
MKLSKSQINSLFSILADADEGCNDRACDNLAEAFGGKLGLGEVLSVPSELSSEKVVSEIQDPELWWESGCVEACEEILELVK